MNLDKDPLPHNTPAARAAQVNAPQQSSGLDFGTYPRSVPADLVGWLGDQPYVLPSLGVVLYGPSGTGKTTLGASALRSLASAGIGSTFYWNLVTAPGARVEPDGRPVEPPAPCWFESYSRLLAKNRRERWDEDGWFEQLEDRVTVLMLDDVSVDAKNPRSESFLLRHIEWFYGGRRSIIVTLNIPPARWGVVLGSRVADRLLDVKWFEKVHFAGRSLR